MSMFNEDTVELRDRISALEKQNAELNADLKQQRFNNKHNLSIDQVVCDRILEMEKQNALMKEALESIAFLDEPLADTIEYWEGLSNDRFTETLCTDTFIAREALAKVEND